jgi:hypothetical protein
MCFMAIHLSEDPRICSGIALHAMGKEKFRLERTNHPDIEATSPGLDEHGAKVPISDKGTMRHWKTMEEALMGCAGLTPMWRETGSWNFAPGGTIFSGAPSSVWGPELDTASVTALKKRWKLRDHCTLLGDDLDHRARTNPATEVETVFHGRLITKGQTRPRACMRYQHRICRGNFDIHAPGLDHTGGLQQNAGLSLVSEYSDDFHLCAYASTLAHRDQSDKGNLAKVALSHDKQGQALTVLLGSLKHELNWVCILGDCGKPWKEAPPAPMPTSAAMPAHLLPSHPMAITAVNIALLWEIPLGLVLLHEWTQHGLIRAIEITKGIAADTKEKQRIMDILSPIWTKHHNVSDAMAGDRSYIPEYKDYDCRTIKYLASDMANFFDIPEIDITAPPRPVNVSKQFSFRVEGFSAGSSSGLMAHNQVSRLLDLSDTRGLVSVLGGIAFPPEALPGPGQRLREDTMLMLVQNSGDKLCRWKPENDVFETIVAKGIKFLYLLEIEDATWFGHAGHDYSHIVKHIIDRPEEI